MRKIRLLMFVLLLPAASFAEGFSLVKSGKDGKDICRIRGGNTEQCLPAFTVRGINTDRIELIERLNEWKTAPGTKILSPEVIQSTLDNWSELSVRKLALNPNLVAQRVGAEVLPFFMSVKWIGWFGNNGTIHIEGWINRLAFRELPQLMNKGQVEVQSALSKMVDIREFSDSQSVETPFRWAQFKIIGGNGSADEATLAMLKEVVAPMVMLELATALRNTQQAPSITTKP